MKKLLILGILGTLIIGLGTASAYDLRSTKIVDGMFNWLETNDLWVKDDAIMEESVRFNGDVHIEGTLACGTEQGYNGACYGTPVFCEGIMIDCVGAE